MTAGPQPPADTFVAIALGSNLGDRRAHLERAAVALGRLIRDIRVSTPIDTEPEGVPDEQPPYLNAAAVGWTSLEPADLLDQLLQLEAEQGRRRDGVRSARTLDLDLILYGNRIIDTPGLVVPHPRFRTRRFVLAPLAEIAGDVRDPVSGATIAELLRTIGG